MRGSRAIPWALSAIVHVTIAGLFLWLAATGVEHWRALRADDGPRDAATFSFAAQPPAPAPTAPRSSAPAPSAAQTTATPPVAPAHAVASAVSAAGFDELARMLPRARRALPVPKDMLSIASVRQETVRRVVFLVDASGSMIGGYPSAVAEVVASIGRLSDEQWAAVIVFQHGAAYPAPPGELVRAGATFGQHGQNSLRAWLLDEIAPSGSSDPRAAMRAAIALKPDSIVVVSAGLLGASDLAADRELLLIDLEALNPLDTRTQRRPVQIACIHLMDPEPLGALEAIAHDHGGPGAYRFIARLSELGNPVEAPLIADATQSRLEAALVMLAKGETARARIELLKVGFGQPLHRASPIALVSAAEISLLSDKDPVAALALASTARDAAKAFGLSAASTRAESIAKAAAEAIRTTRHTPSTP